MKRHNLDLIHKNYSEKELEENFDLFHENDWMWISCKQKLSEGFIEKHQDKVDWKFISRYQSISNQFIQNHIDKLDIYLILHNSHISYEIKEEIKTLKEII